MVKVVRVEERLLLPNGLRTWRWLWSSAVKAIAATINVVPSDQMLRSIRFIVAMNALRCGVSNEPGRSDYPNLMDADQPVVLDVFLRSQLSKVTLDEFAEERVLDGRV